jgi:acyl dehydratase
MNQYRFDEINIGLTASFMTIVSDEKQEMFRIISGDMNPLHEDSAFAKAKGFDDKLVYGMLVANFYSALAGVYLPGENSLIHSIEVKMLKPTYIGDELLVHGIVTETSDLFQRITVKAEIKNQHQDIVSKAVIKIGVL